MNILKNKLSEMSFKDFESLMNLCYPGLKRYLEEYLDDPTEANDRNIFYIKDKNEIIAWSLVGKDEDFGQENDGTISLHINKKHRGQGLGVLLFKESVTQVESMNFNNVLVYGHDEASSKFYNSKSIKSLMNNSKSRFEIIT